MRSISKSLGMGLRFFLENNNKTQTISLVKKRFKLFWFLAIRVKRTRFLGFLFYYLPAAELVEWPRRQKLSPMYSVSKLRKRVQRTRFLRLETESFEPVF